MVGREIGAQVPGIEEPRLARRNGVWGQRVWMDVVGTEPLEAMNDSFGGLCH